MRLEPLHRLGGYREYRPPPDLREVVGALWIYARPTEGGAPSAGPGHRVLPEPGVSLVFRCVRDRDGSAREAALILHGPILTPRVFRPPPGLHLEGVRLKPEWCRDLLGVDPPEHADAERDLSDLAPRRAGRLRRRLAGTRSSREALDLLLAQVRRALAGSSPSRSPLLAHAGLERIRGPRRDALDLAGLAVELGVSTRHLRRVIREQTGLGPKRLQRILRLGRAVYDADRAAHPPWARVAVGAGFYDQAHLIRECRDLTHRTPVELHAERRAQAAPFPGG